MGKYNESSTELTQAQPESFRVKVDRMVNILRSIPKEILGRMFTEDLSHETFVDMPTDVPLTIRDIKKYYGADQARSYLHINKALANGKPLKGLIRSSEGSRVSSDAARNFKPKSFPEI